MVDIDERIEEKLLYLNLAGIDTTHIQEIYEYRKSYNQKYGNFIFLEDYTFPCFTIGTRYFGGEGTNISSIWKNSLPIMQSGINLNKLCGNSVNPVMDFIENETTLEDILINCGYDNTLFLSNEDQTEMMNDVWSYGRVSFPTKKLAKKCLIGLFQENIDSLKLCLSE